jgi:Mce-associated membrane protein
MIALRRRGIQDGVQEAPDASDADAEGADKPPATAAGTIGWPRVLVYGVLPGLALLLGLVAGFLKYQDVSVSNAERASAESLQAAKDSTVALLSYRPDTVERDLAAGRDMTTGQFRDSYTQLTNDVVIPGAKQQQITAVATIPAASTVSANEKQAVALVFVDQAVTMGKDKPSSSLSSVRVTLDKVGDRWLVSGFDPV